MGNRPPQALDVEEAVLGAMLVEPSTIDESMEELSPSCFYDPKHRMVFEAMMELVNEHVSIDMITVSNKLRSKGELETVGGPVALAGLTQKIGAAAHIEYYIKILKQKTIQRDLITASYDILKQSYDDSINVDDLIDVAQTKVFAAIQNNVKKDVQDIGSIINTAMADIQEMQASAASLPVSLPSTGLPRDGRSPTLSSSRPGPPWARPHSASTWPGMPPWSTTCRWPSSRWKCRLSSLPRGL